jgi:hypothetical protein
MVNTSTENPYSVHHYSTVQDQPNEIASDLKEIKNNFALMREEKSN